MTYLMLKKVVRVTLLCLCAAACRSTGDSAPESRFAFLDGNLVHYESRGHGGEAIVFVHGWGGSGAVWRDQVTDFAPRTRVITIDLPGHGSSDAPRIDYTIDLFSRAVVAVLDDAGVKKATLVGHSLGAIVVRNAYRRHPGRVSALVLVDGWLRALGTTEEHEAFTATFRAEDYKEGVANFVRSLLPEPGSETLQAELVTAMSRTPQWVLVSAMENITEATVYGTDPIRAPAQAIFAKRFMEADEETFLRGFIGDLDFRAWEDVGHFPMMEKPARFNDEMVEFLERRKILATPSPRG
jgi:pimeloyl-ACP methyl ester carboxylesterase